MEANTATISTIWLVISALATLTLAVAAFVTIKKTSSMQKEQRKHELINDVIEWSRDVLEFGASKHMIDTLRELEEFSQTKRFILYRLSEVLELQGGFATILRRSSYIEKVVAGFQNDGLSKAFEQLTRLLGAHRNVLEELHKTIPNEADKFDEAKWDEAYRAMIASLGNLRTYAQALISQATEIKVKLTC